MSEDYQPTMLGNEVRFHEDEGGEPGMITDETMTDVYIESSFFTGWMSKAEYWEALGIE